MQNENLRWLGLVLAVSVLVRLGMAFYLGDVVDAPPLLTDQRSYHALGARLLEGQGYSFEQNWYPFTLANAPTAHWSFLYSLFIAATYALFGIHPLAARLVQVALGGVLLPWMVYRLARQAISWPSPSSPSLRAIPLIAAAIAAVYGYYVLYAATLMTETFYIVALLWSLEIGLKIGGALRYGEKIPITLALQLGLSLGLAALLRQSILPWVPLLCLWLLWQAWQGKRLMSAVRTIAVTALVLMVCIMPWTYRNYRVYGRFLLLNSNTGYAMFSAQHPMHGINFREFEAAPLPKGWWGQSESELDRNLMQVGIGFVLDDPGRYLLLSLSRVRAFFEFWPTPDTTLVNNIGRVGSFGLFLPLMVYGMYLTTRNLQFLTHNSLLFLFVAFYTLLHVLTWAMVRYRLPVDAVLIILASMALLDLYTRGRRWLSDRNLADVSMHSSDDNRPQAAEGALKG